MLRRTAITFIDAILAAAALPAAAQDGKTLNFGIISTESSSNQKQVWQPVIDDLSRAIGVPVNLFTGIFALARTVGWIAQLNEQMADPEYKIGRPRQLFTGSVSRDVKPIGQR